MPFPKDIPFRQLDLGSAKFFAPQAEEPAGNQITVLAGWFTTAFPNQNIVKANQNTVAFAPVSTTNRVRWDLVHLDKTGTPLIVQGAEQVAPVPDFTGAPAPPRNTSFPVALVKIEEDGAVVITADDITDIRPGFFFVDPIPTGVFKSFLGSSAPEGWLIMNGDTIGNDASSADHKGEIFRDLFNLLNNVLPNTGVGVFDNGDTVVVPNAQGKIPVGFDSGDVDFDSLGKTGGVKEHDNSHVHGLNNHVHGIGSHTHAITPEGGHDHGGRTGLVDGTNYANVFPNPFSGGAGFNGANPGNLAEHDHLITSVADHDHGGSTGTGSGNTDPVVGDTTLAGNANESNLQPFLTTNYIIKI